jgi:hypothetical protein
MSTIKVNTITPYSDSVVNISASVITLDGSQISSSVNLTGSLGINGSSILNGNLLVTGSLTTSGSLTTFNFDSGSVITPTQSATPTFNGVDGQFLFGTDGGNHYIYVWMAGAWRSGSLG